MISFGDVSGSGHPWEWECCTFVAWLEGSRQWIHTQLSLFVIVDLCKATWVVDDLGWIIVGAVLVEFEGWS